MGAAGVFGGVHSPRVGGESARAGFGGAFSG